MSTNKEVQTLRSNPLLVRTPEDNRAVAFYKSFVHKHGPTKAGQILRTVFIKYKEQYGSPTVPVIAEGLMPLVVRLAPLVPLSTIAKDLVNLTTKRRGLSKQRTYQLLLYVLSEFCLFLEENIETDEEAEQVIQDIKYYEERWLDEYGTFYESNSYTRCINAKVLR